MKLIRTEDAVGHVLCHDLTQIIKDQYKDARFRKGHVVAPEDIPVLLSIGITALISGITIGGKALGKTVAINDCTNVVYRVARVMHTLHLFR